MAPDDGGKAIGAAGAMCKPRKLKLTVTDAETRPSAIHGSRQSVPHMRSVNVPFWMVGVNTRAAPTAHDSASCRESPMTSFGEFRH